MLSQIEGIFIFALIWSVGATGDTEGRAAFDVFFRTLLDGKMLEKDLQELVPAVKPFALCSAGSWKPMHLLSFYFHGPALLMLAAHSEEYVCSRLQCC